MNTKKYLNIPIEKELYKREYCKELAKSISEKALIEGMTNSQLAAEIFAHAYVYYNFRFVPGFLKKTSLAKRLYLSVENGVDLEDNGDKLFRRICYRVIWLMPAFAI